MRESAFEARVVRRLKREFPGCIVFKNDPNQNQGVPDRLVLFGDRWAMLEVKVSANAPSRPNQGWYITRYNNMSYASFIFPENEDLVFHELQAALCNIR